MNRLARLTAPDLAQVTGATVSPSGVEAFRGVSREQFLGSPRITPLSNASSLKPRELTTVREQPELPFIGSLTYRQSPDGIAVYDNGKVVASYNFGDTLVVDPKYRRQGIGEELVYRWRISNPDAPPASHRTRVSQGIQEKVYDRIQREILGRQVGAATPAALAATAAAAGTGAALETERRREAPQQNRLSWIVDSAKARWQRTFDDVRQTASAIADVAPDVYNGLSRLPYRVLGAPVDLADTVVRPAAAFAGADYGNPVGGSDWMIAQAQEAGLLPPSSGSTAEMAGDVLGGLLDVSPATEAAMVSRAMRGPRAEIFAGQKAATADLAAMRRAEERLASGDDPAKVWAEEGWFRGPDGQMRFEIDDSRADFDPSTAAQEIYDRPSREGDVIGLSSAAYHPDLLAAYPEMAQQTVGFLPVGRMRGADAAFSEQHGRYTFPAGGVNNPAKERSFGIHEMQHDVQAREGFARGGNLDTMAVDYEADIARLPEVRRNVEVAKNRASDAARLEIARNSPIVRQAEEYANSLGPFSADQPIEKKVEDFILLSDEGFRRSYKELSNLDRLSRLDPFQRYRRLAGEAEARAVQARIPLSAAERRARYPLEDYDVPLDELIIRR